MNQLKKLNAIHKTIMTILEGSVVLYQGSLKEGWNEFDHIQHTSDNLPGQIEIFERQLNKTLENIENENVDFVKESLDLYKRDREVLKHNIQFDQIDKRLFDSILIYINQLNELITLLEDLIQQ